MYLITNEDQYHCVPDRFSIENLFLLRDLFDLDFGGDVHFDVVSFNQEKAFDRVNHNYMFRFWMCLALGTTSFQG